MGRGRTLRRCCLNAVLPTASTMCAEMHAEVRDSLARPAQEFLRSRLPRFALLRPLFAVRGLLAVEQAHRLRLSRPLAQRRRRASSLCLNSRVAGDM